MTKRRRKRKPVPPPNRRFVTREERGVTVFVLLVTFITVGCTTLTTLITVIKAVGQMMGKSMGMSPAYVEITFNGSILLGLLLLIQFKRVSDIVEEKNFNFDTIRRLRPRMVVMLSLSVFQLGIILIQFLYMFGIIEWFTLLIQRWSPVGQQISTNAYIAIAFIAGAVISGVIGNLSYDLLKYAVRKRFTKK